MSENVNGWSVIARHLLQQGKNQSDLAKMLDVSPAAVTQIKNGDFQLNSKQLQAIVAYLSFNTAATDEFYTEIFNARIHHCHGERINALGQFRCVVKTQNKNSGDKIPLGSVELLKKFNPAFEPLHDFLARRSVERVKAPFRSCDVMIRTEKDDDIIGVPSRYRLGINSKSYPVPEEKVLVAWQDNKFSVGIYRLDGQQAKVVPADNMKEHFWALFVRHQNSMIRWLHPLLCLEAENAMAQELAQEF